MGGSHETPFKMKGSGHYGLGNSSPAKHWKDGKTDKEKLAAAYHNEHMRKKPAATKFKSSPAKQEKFAAEHGAGKSWAHKHKERPAHQNTAAAHNVKGNEAEGREVMGDA